LALSVLLNKDLISASADKTIRIWSIENCVTKSILGGHSDSVWVVISLPNGDIATSSADSTIKIWSKNIMSA
jgi:WD40 repeat protein